MAGRDDLLAELPAENPDEPSSLRQDIADELRDHLECAARRESLKNSNPQTLEERVLFRFGNPQKIACKLWFDAMKEILMTQKITLVLFSIVAFASLAACGLMWSLARDFQSASADAQAASAKLLAQGQETNSRLLKQNQEMMQKLSALANRPEDPQPHLDWVPLKIQVVKADGKDTHAEGFEVQVSGKALTESENVSLHEMTGKTGVADFGVVRPGQYFLYLNAPWGESHSSNFLVKPGMPLVLKIESPTGQPKAIEAKPIVKWPKEFEGKDLAVLVTASRADHTTIGERYWSGGGEMHLLIRPSGRFATYQAVYPGQTPEGNDFRGAPPYGTDGTLEFPTVNFADEGKVHTDSFSWNGTEVALSGLKLVKLAKEAEFPGPRDSLVCITQVPALENAVRALAPAQSNSQFPKLLAKYKSQGEGIQEWPIEIPEPDFIAAKAALTAEDFPNLPPGYVAGGVLWFLDYDKDGNQQLSQEELTPISRSLEGVFKEFPVSFKTFIEGYVESRKNRASSRSGRG